MKAFKPLNQAGMTMIELVVAFALTSILGGIIFSVMEYADKQAKLQTEDIQSLILRLGASKVIARDIANAAPSFNYINFEDDSGRPFFVLAQNEACQGATCVRTFSMKIPDGETTSDPLFLLTIKGEGYEMLRFGVDPFMPFNLSSNAYIGVNAEASVDPATGIAQSVLPFSPWKKGRLVMLQTANQFYDCMSTVNTFSPSPGSQCAVTCNPSGTCDYAASRQLKLLGVVNDDEVDMQHTPVQDRNFLLKTNYKICRPDQNMVCKVPSKYIDGLDLKTAKELFELMPYVPGSDNLTSFTPVELVRYHLERPSPNSPDSKIVFMRSAASVVTTNVGKKLSFERAHILMTGVQSIVFTRKSVSNPTIEYKLIKARMNQR